MKGTMYGHAHTLGILPNTAPISETQSNFTGCCVCRLLQSHFLLSYHTHCLKSIAGHMVQTHNEQGDCYCLLFCIVSMPGSTR